MTAELVTTAQAVLHCALTEPVDTRKLVDNS